MKICIENIIFDTYDPEKSFIQSFSFDLTDVLKLRNFYYDLAVLCQVFSYSRISMDTQK